jgi:RHS repeat-associated protein
MAGSPTELRWTKDNIYLGGQLLATAAPGGVVDSVAMAAADGRLFAVDGDGRLRWRPAVADQADWQDIDLEDAPRILALAAADGQLYGAGSDGALWRRKATTSSADVWRRFGAAPGIVAMAAANGRLLAFDHRNVMVERPIAGTGDWSPNGRGGAARVASMAAADGTLFSLLANGELSAEGLSPSSSRKFIGLAAGAVTLAASDGKLFAVDRDEGLRWRPATVGPASWQDVGGTGELVRYHHPDRLGTPRLVTKASGAVARRQATLPFGTISEAESTSGPSDWFLRSVATVDNMNGASSRHFTSYDRSAATGLDYAVNRYYDPQQGQFLQPDPLGIAGSDLADPQSLNLYAYAQNDPVNAVDPLGLKENAEDSCSEPAGDAGGGGGCGGGGGGGSPPAPPMHEMSQEVDVIGDLPEPEPECIACGKDLVPPGEPPGGDGDGGNGEERGPRGGGGGGGGGSGGGGASKPRSVPPPIASDPEVFFWCAAEHEEKGGKAVTMGTFGENIEIFGLNTTGPFFAHVTAGGVQVGKDKVYGAVWGGKEIVYQITPSGSRNITEIEPIIGGEGGYGPFVGGIYQTGYVGEKDTGVYAGVKTDHFSFGGGMNLEALSILAKARAGACLLPSF